MSTRKPLISLLSLALFLSCDVPALHAQLTDFDFTQEVIQLPEGFSPVCIDLADVDQDGDFDAVVCGRNIDELALFLEGGPGGTLAPAVELGVPNQMDWAEFADFNEDGFTDVVLGARSLVGLVVIFDGLPGGEFSEEPRTIRVCREIRATRVGDLDQDSHQDLVVVGHASEEVQILIGDGAGAFEFGSRIRASPWRNGFPYPQSAELIDLDSDGFLDIAAIGLGSRTIDLSFNDQLGGFTRTRSWTAPIYEDGSRPGCSNGEWADFDGDGQFDCLLSLTDFGAQQFAILKLDDTGEITETTLHPGSTSGLSWFPSSGDFDGDGDVDVVIGHALPGTIAFFENITQPEGELEFLYPQIFPGTQFIRFLRSIDLDQDGDIDLIAADFSGDRLVVFRNNQVGGLARSAVDSSPRGHRASVSTLPTSVVEDDGRDGSSLVKWLSDLSATDVRTHFPGSRSNSAEVPAVGGSK